MAKGRFITLEGGEGVGKSTQLRALEVALNKRGIDVVTTREPGGSDGAEKIRELLLAPDAGWSVRAEALLFAAARADHVETVIRPAIEAGLWVLSDRFLDSSLAYQGGAGGLGMEAVRALHRFGSGDYLPDRTFVLGYDDGVERAQARDGGEGDRIGARPAAYHRAVAASFQEIAREEPQRVRMIDAAGRPEQVTARLLEALSDLLP